VPSWNSLSLHVFRSRVLPRVTACNNNIRTTYWNRKKPSPESCKFYFACTFDLIFFLFTPRRWAVPMPQEERPVRGPGAMRQVLRVQRRRGHDETVPWRVSVRPTEQEDQQMRPAVQRGLRRKIRTPWVLTVNRVYGRVSYWLGFSQNNDDNNITWTFNSPAENPQSSYLCPRRNGYFAHPDEKVCNIFYNCIEGDGTEIVCPNGLHFDEYAGSCAWPATAGRTGCNESDDSKTHTFIYFLITTRLFFTPRNPNPGGGGCGGVLIVIIIRVFFSYCYSEIERRLHVPKR